MAANSTPIGRVGLLLSCIGIGFLVFYVIKPTVLLAVATAFIFGFLLMSIRWPETGTLVVLFLLYTNIAVLAVRPPGSEGAAAGPRTVVALSAMWLILGATLIYQVFFQKQKLLFDRGFLLMLAFFGACLASAFFARDEQAIGKYVADYVIEGLALFFLVTNVIRDYATLRRATWVLLLAGSIMSSFSIMQRVTHTEQNTYDGFALMDRGPQYGSDDQETVQRQRAAGKIGSGGELVGQARAGGPVDASNLYAGILVVLLPLAILRFRTEVSQPLRMLAVIAGGLIFGGLLLTFSRGSLLAALVVFIMMSCVGLMKFRQLLIAAVAAALLIIAIEPTVVTRMLTLGQINAFFSGSALGDQGPDSSVVLRYELDVAALRVFRDHPFLGVGPGQFAGYYSMDYVNRVGFRQLTKGYQAHNLYFQALAETGLVGFVSFVSIMATIMWGLWRERDRSAHSHPELALTASGFFFSLATLSIFSFFSHLINQRYFWLMFALSSAATRILHRLSEEDAAEVSPPLLSSAQRLWLEAGDAPLR
jgi:O-antigen ligase/polysaccharide polymerase Wzy-like membrane protein